MQEQLLAVFNVLKPLLKRYEPPFQPKFDLNSKYDLWSYKEAEIAGRKRKEISFAAIIIQSSYVGFYYMPVYTDTTDTTLQDVFSPRLRALLKGKSCFHIKSVNAELEQDIAKALKIGFLLYKKRGWV